MKVSVRSVFPCNPEFVWDRVQTSQLLRDVTWPLLRFTAAPKRSLPAQWAEGETVECRLFLFGLLPLGRHRIYFERIDPERCQILTNEESRLVRSWRHRIGVVPAADGRTEYADEVEIDAGRLTRLVGLFAVLFYRHRHRRWRSLVQKHATTA